MLLNQPRPQIFYIFIIFSRDGECRILASSSKDSTIKIWDTTLLLCKITLSSHTQCVTSLRWGGTNLLYTGSQDRTIKVWRPEDVSGAGRFSFNLSFFLLGHLTILFNRPPKPEACFSINTRNYVRSPQWSLSMARTQDLSRHSTKLLPSSIPVFIIVCYVLTTPVVILGYPM